MRARTAFLVLPLLLVAGFVALNWTEFQRPASLNFGIATLEAPLGFVMLALLGLLMLVYLVSAGSMKAESMLIARQYSREISAQRELADKAEASRFTELRSFLDTQAKESLVREEALVRTVAAAVKQSQQELQLRIDQAGSSLAASIGELENRLERLDVTGQLNAVV